MMDRQFVLNVVACNGMLLASAENFKNDKAIVLAAIRQDKYAFNYASKELMMDREFALNAVACNGMLLASAEKFKNDKAIVLAAVKQDGRALQYAGAEMKKDMDFALTAITENSEAFDFFDEELKNSSAFLKKVIERNDGVVNRYYDFKRSND